MKALITPNGSCDSKTVNVIRLCWLVGAVAVWLAFKPAVMPTPWDVILSLPRLWFESGLGDALRSSFITNVKALAISTLLALPIAYLSRVPALGPLARGISQLRFLSPAVFFLVLLFVLGSASSVKVAMLVLGEVFFLTTTMVNAVTNIPEESYDEARVLRMSEWQATWYVTIRGTLDTALEAIRDNAAIGWSMLMMVEGVIRSEGGVGVLLLNQERYLNFDAVYAIALSVLLVGIGQDLALRWMRGELCPHTRL